MSLSAKFKIIFCRRYFIKKSILKTYPPNFMILNVDFALKLSNYTSWKHLNVLNESWFKGFCFKCFCFK